MILVGRSEWHNLGRKVEKEFRREVRIGHLLERVVGHVLMRKISSQIFPIVGIDCQWDFQLFFMMVFNTSRCIDCFAAYFCISPLNPYVEWKICCLGWRFGMEKEGREAMVSGAWGEAKLRGKKSYREKMIRRNSESSQKQKFTAREYRKLTSIPTPCHSQCSEEVCSWQFISSK